MRKKLDKIFSKYIRLRDSNEYGYCYCVTCGAYAHWETMDCGHYIRRRKDTVRWNELNAHAQCSICNREKDGNEKIYREKLIEMYGLEAVESLEIQANIHAHFLPHELEEMNKYYLDKIKEL